MNHTLLRFPGGDAQNPIACTYCPELCRFSCPTAVVSANDAVTPRGKNSLLYTNEKWPGKPGMGAPELWPIYDCTGCGRCTEYCVYEMPVKDFLFEARSKYRWERAERAAEALTDEADPVGDLAYELGDRESAARRLERYLKRRKTVMEPKSLYYAREAGAEAGLEWERALGGAAPPELLRALGEKRWLVHESVWLSRNLGRGEDVARWVAEARRSGARLVMPYQSGKDCVDCGGEGAYPLLFADQAARMARDLWERDRHRADGVLCFSARCAGHLRTALGAGVPVLVVAEFGRG